MKTLSRFRAKSISGSGDIDRGHKKPPPPPPDLQGSKKPRLNRVKICEKGEEDGQNWENSRACTF